MAFSDDGHGGGDHNLSNGRVLLDGFGEQSPMAQSSTLAISFSKSTVEREASNNYRILDLMGKKKREVERKIAETNMAIQKSRAEREKMNQNNGSLQSKKQVLYTLLLSLGSKFQRNHA